MEEGRVTDTGRLNVLVLHALGDLTRTRKTSLNHLTFLSRYEPDHNYLYHDLHAPVTDALRSIRFHAVLFDTTFLCWRYARPRSLFEEMVERYSFLAETDAAKLAFPQDEYDHGEILDDWLSAYRVDVVYSVVWNCWDLVFRKTAKHATLLQALTGYVDDQDLERGAEFRKPFGSRRIDVGYRARNLPPQFGSHGQLKVTLGARFLEACRGRDLRTDISTRPEDVFLGLDWLRFLGDCRFMLGCEGGSSIWDPRGEIGDRVRSHLAEHPDAGFDEVAAQCFPGEDRRWVFSAISPRLFEVAAAETAQILVPAPYLGVLEPRVHYIPFEQDLSNADEMFELMSDAAAAGRMIEACRAALLEPARFRYRTHAASVLGKIREVSSRKGVVASGQAKFEELASLHRRETAAYERRTATRERRARIARTLLSGARAIVPASVRRTVRRWIYGRG